jgi:hypothetical protein
VAIVERVRRFYCRHAKASRLKILATSLWRLHALTRLLKKGKNLMTRNILFAIVSIHFWAVAAAATDYDFIQTGTGDLLATLSTNGADPFDDADFTGLTFSSDGSTLFGFGSGLYLGTFDSTTSLFTSDGIGGLTTTTTGTTATDVAPPALPANGLGTAFSLELFADTAAGSDSITVSFEDDTPDAIIATGDWLAVGVPEPSALVLATWSIVAMAGWRRRRRRS